MVGAVSAIAGILRLDDRPVEDHDVSAMLAAMDYRGTTPPLLSTSGAACIGDFSDRSDQPVQTDTATIIAADARIDNIIELLRTLRTDGGNAMRSLLLQAYEAWEENCARRLLGDFSLAIWDERRQRLVCIRDHLGVRPLYYCHIPRRWFAFASEVKALLALPDFVARVDETRIADFLASSFTDMQHTFYEGVRRLPPAHTLTVTAKGITLRRFWEPDPYHTVRYSSDAEYASAFRAIFTEAVRCRLEPAANLGVTLSGGLDSSSVTCMARHLLRGGTQQLSTFSIFFGDASNEDERRFITAVTRAGDLRDDHLTVRQQSPLRHLERISRHCDGPGCGQYASDYWELYSQAAASGVGVLLDGCDGDVTISYNFRYLGELARRLRWVSMLREAHGLNQRYFSNQTSMWRLVMSYCVPPLLPSWEWLWRARRSFRTVAPEPGPHSLISERFAARSGLTARLDMYRRNVASLHTHRAVHAHILAHPMLPQAFEVTDNLCAAFSIEHRHPFYDKRLVEFCLALPREQLIRDGWTRPILRRALANLLPPDIRQRGGKGGSAAPRRLACLERRVLEETAQDEEALGDYLDMGRLRTVTRRYLDGGAVTDDETLWPAVSLRQWLRSTVS